MSVYIDPITGEISYNNIASSGGSATSGTNKGQQSTSTSRDTVQTAKDTSVAKVKSQVIEYCEGVVGLLPNPKYMAKTIYNIQGVGAIFSGNYYFKKVRHTIGGETYTVEADVAKMDTLTFDLSSNSNSNRPAVDPAPQKAPVAPAQPSYTMHHIVWGDTLWGLAHKYYGNGALYNRIFEANRDTVKNPNLIYTGKWLRIPK